MPSTREELASFQEFVVGRLAIDSGEASLDELFVEWYDSRHQDDINEAIRRGLADLEAGRYTPADEAMEAIRKEFGLPME